jgi:hypothetical protein
MYLIAVIFFAKQLRKTLKNIDLPRKIELNDKNKLHFSGSLEESSNENKEVLEESSISPKEIGDALQKLLESEWGEEIFGDACAPTYILDLDKDVDFLYSLTRRNFVPVRNRTEVFLFNDDPLIYNIPKRSGNYYLINNEIFDIDPKNIICIGWN